MEVLYLTYGTQSGVVVKLSKELRKFGINISSVNVAKNINYRYSKLKIPRFSLFNVVNMYIATKCFKELWKEGYVRTDVAFSTMSSNAEKEIARRKECKVVLQSGLLFSPKNTNNKPYVLGILDNTYLIGKLGRNRPVTSLNLSERFLKKEKEAYERADLILVMSKNVRDSLVEDYGISENKIVVTGVGPNCEPSPDFMPSSEKYESKKVVMIGMDFVNKGGNEVLEAYKVLKRKIPALTLTVIGDKPDLVVEGVSFLGVQGRERVAKELAEANLFVMPSHAEAFGVAFLEAMAFRTPCVGSRIEAIPEIISDGETGFVVNPLDVEQLTKRMEDVLSDPVLAKKMGAAGFEKYQRQFCWTKVGRNISDHLYRFA